MVDIYYSGNFDTFVTKYSERNVNEESEGVDSLELESQASSINIQTLSILDGMNKPKKHTLSIMVWQ